MNVLADEQQKIFESGISELEKAKRQQAFYDLYYKTRKKDENIKARLAEWPYFSLEYIEGMIYKPKGSTPYNEAFAHLNTITPTMQNAFLFNKRLK